MSEPTPQQIADARDPATRLPGNEPISYAELQKLDKPKPTPERDQFGYIYVKSYEVL